MTQALPDPLVPAEVDLRDQPIPLREFALLAAKFFDVSANEAEAMVRGWALINGVRVDEGSDE